MWFAIVLGVPLAVTGVIMEEGSFLFWPISSESENNARILHRLVSTKFALVLAVMMITGFVMWGVPKILARRVASKVQ